MFDVASERERHASSPPYHSRHQFPCRPVMGRRAILLVFDTEDFAAAFLRTGMSIYYFRCPSVLRSPAMLYSMIISASMMKITKRAIAYRC